MSAYEMMFIARPTLDDEALAALTERLSGVITAQGGAVDEIEKLGKKRFAYEIDGIREGHYTLMVFQGPPALPAELDRVVRISDEIVRHLIVKHIPPSQTTPRAPVSRPVPKPVERPRPASAPTPARPEGTDSGSQPAPAQAEAAAEAAPNQAEAAAPAAAAEADAPVAAAPAVAEAAGPAPEVAETEAEKPEE